MSQLVGVVGPGLLYGLAALACPLGMGAMMWMMMRGGKNRPPGAGQWSPPDPRTGDEGELVRLRAEIDQLKAERDRPSTSTHRP